jgi:tellurite resistance protein TerC
MESLMFWAAFVGIYAVVFSLDMFVVSRRGAEMKPAEALRWTGLWFAVALVYGAGVYFWYPQTAGHAERTGTVLAVKYLSGYLTEYCLSIDNLFVFIMVFSMMGVNEANRPRLLKLGILLSIVLRVLFIFLGMGLVSAFHWLLYIFGGVLLITAYKMAFSGDDEHVDPESNFLFKAATKILSVDPDPDPQTFLSKRSGKLHITRLFLVFLVIGSTDVMFALDSIPAIVGVVKEGSEGVLTAGQEDFIAITSNVFAVMGLSSLFFALEGLLGKFRYLQHGVSAILAFIALKMILSGLPSVSHFFEGHAWVSLAVIAGAIAISIFISVVAPAEAESEEA